MSKLIKTTCSRCNGSGNYSFNLVRGTVCFKCNGDGATLVDAAKEAKRIATKAKRDSDNAKAGKIRAELAIQVREELNTELGPFSDDAKGSYDMACACQRQYGKTPGDIVSERLRNQT